jgi:hypothetical protein
MLWRRRKYLADACAVQLTRNPDGLARALKKLDDDGGAIPGSSWASHLFLVNPGHSASEALSPRQKEILAQAWAASAQPMQPAGKQAGPTDFDRILKEGGAMYRSAFAGDTQAMARVHELRQAISTLDPALAAEIPDPADLAAAGVDLAAARKGDAAAIKRLLALSRQTALQRETSPRPQPQKDADQPQTCRPSASLAFTLPWSDD